MEDTPENRASQAERLLASNPPTEMMSDMADNVAMNLPPEDRQEFRRLMTEFVDVEVLAAAMRQSMIRTYSADELAALADFYESQHGKAAIKKMGIYMAEVLPVVEAEVLRAIGELERVKAEENRAKPDLE